VLQQSLSLQTKETNECWSHASARIVKRCRTIFSHDLVRVGKRPDVSSLGDKSVAPSPSRHLDPARVVDGIFDILRGGWGSRSGRLWNSVDQGGKRHCRSSSSSRRSSGSNSSNSSHHEVLSELCTQTETELVFPPFSAQKTRPFVE